MGSQRRGRAVHGRLEANPSGEEPTDRPRQKKLKSFEIPKRLVFEAWKKVRANSGAPGVDAVSIDDFAADEVDNLYKLWNRMSSGSYFPGPVRTVEIPKDHGAGVRVLGVANVADRVAQTAAAMLGEEKLEPIFHPDSYRYRPGRSAHDALAVARKRCWNKDWVLDLDVGAFFDSVGHDLLMKAVAHHSDERWVLLYIQRWLKAPMTMTDRTTAPRETRTPQGSPISPLLANLFMHYAFDRWMDREHSRSLTPRHDQIISEWVAQAHPHTTVEAITSPPGFVAECDAAPGALAIGRSEQQAREQMRSVLFGWASLVAEDGDDLPALPVLP